MCALTNQDKGKILRKKINKQMKHVVSREIKLKMGEKKENWREKKHLKREKTKKNTRKCKHTIILTKEKSIFNC